MKRFISLLTSFLIIFSSAFSVFAADADVSVCLDKIFEYRIAENGASDIQALVDKLSENPASGNEWTVMSIRNRYKNIDYSLYRAALEKYVSENEISNHTSKLRLALVLLSLDSESDYINKAADSIGKAGIMSWVFGLHLLNNGLKCSISQDECLREILALQHADGGWSVLGENGDTDVTAMVLQSFGPYKNREDVKTSAENAVDFLSAKQLQSGGYFSYGVECSESTANVIMALCTMGIDPLEESFVKDNSLLDALLSYQKEDGSFSHAAGGDSNKTSTFEAEYALVSYEQYLNGGGQYYVFGPLSEIQIERTDNTGTNAESNSISVKTILYIAAAAYAVIGCIILVVKKKKLKSFISVLAVAAVLFAAISFIDIRSTDDYYDASENTDSGIYTTVSVYCDTVKGKKDYIPDDGIILQYETVSIKSGSSAYDQLVEACRTKNIALDSEGSYVKGIGHLYEFDFGDLSGWMFKVNGEFSGRGSDEIKLSDGDYVEWIYTTDLGHDIGNDYSGK